MARKEIGSCGPAVRIHKQIKYCPADTSSDMAIAVPGVVASTNDVVSVENSLNSLFAIQDPATGQLPYAGRPFFSVLSFTYHLYTLIGVTDHYLYTVSSVPDCVTCVACQLILE